LSETEPEIPDQESGELDRRPGRGSVKENDYTDSRKRWDWKSRYPDEARKKLNFEAWVLGSALVFWCLVSMCLLCVSGKEIKLPSFGLFGADGQPLELTFDFRILAIYSVGAVGGTTFSIKWLVHSAARGWWHLDRRYWRFFVPLLGGVYACVGLTLYDSGLWASGTVKLSTIASAAGLAFLLGYFSDGVSGLLTNIANAVFGTVHKK
jgi:hypothetical protein